MERERCAEWADILRRYGFCAAVGGSDWVDLGQETRENREFLSRILDTAGGGRLDDSLRRLTVITVPDEDRCVDAYYDHFTNHARDGADLRGIEPHIAGLVRLFHDLGLSMFESCEGHARTGRLARADFVQPNLVFCNEYVAAEAAFLLGVAARKVEASATLTQARGELRFVRSPGRSRVAEDLSPESRFVARAAATLRRHEIACRELLRAISTVVEEHDLWE